MKKKQKRKAVIKPKIQVAEAVQVRFRLGTALRVGITIAIVGIAGSLLYTINKPGATPTTYSLTIEVPAISRQQVTSPDGAVYERFSSAGSAERTNDTGKPEVPVMHEQVALPCGATNVRVAASGTPDRATLRYPIYPAPKNVPKKSEDGTETVDPEFFVDQSAYNQNAWYPVQSAAVESVNMLRGSVCYATVAVYPYRYNPVEHTLLSALSMQITLTWTNPAQIASAPESIGEHFDSTVQSMRLRNVENSGAKNIEQLNIASSQKNLAPAVTDGSVTYVTNLLVDQSPAPPHTDYILIANNDLVNTSSSALNQLATFRSQAAHGGYDVSVVKVSDILATPFPDIANNPGHQFTDAEKIKVFLKYVYDNWNGAEPAPEFVLLAGDGDGTADQKVPIFISQRGDVLNTQTDFWFSANLDQDYPAYLSDDSNPIGDYFIGRFPVKNDAELQNAVNKTIQLESVAPLTLGAWRSQAELLTGYRSDADNVYLQYSASLFSNIRTNTLDPHALEALSLNRNLTGDGMDTASHNQYKADSLAAFSAGRMFVVNSSHGSVTTWSDGTPYQNIFATTDMQYLQNSTMPPIVFALSCSTAAFENATYQSLGEAFLKQEANGAAAYIGATADAYISDTDIMQNIFRAMLNQGLTTVGSAVTAGKNMTFYGRERITFTYLGDPALDIGQTLQDSTGLPDLSGFLNGYSVSNGQVAVTATISNTGFANTANIPLALFERGGALVPGATATVASSTAGTSSDVTITFPQPPSWTRGFADDLELHIDHQNQILELNENNNTSLPIHLVVYDHQEYFVQQGFEASQSNARIVFTSMKDGNADIYLYDRGKDTVQRITTDGNVQQTPVIDESVVAWYDSRNNVPAIYTYNTSTGQERQISSRNAAPWGPKISGTNIVWQDDRNNNGDIYASDLTTGQERRLTTNSADQITPSISGNTVVWEDWRNGNADVYSFDLTTGQERQVTTTVSDQGQPVISGNVIVWIDNRNGSYDLYSYDLMSGTERRVTDGSGDETQPAFSGNTLAWVDTRNGGTDMYSLTVGADGIPGTADDGITQQLTDNPSIQRSSPNVSGGMVLYTGVQGVLTNVMRVDASQQFSPTATNRDGVQAGGFKAPLLATDLGAAWVRVNIDLDGSPSPDVSVAQAYLDAGKNVVLTFSNRNPNNISDPGNEFNAYVQAGFPFPETDAGKQQYQTDVRNVLTPLLSYLSSGRMIYVQAGNEIIDSTYWPTSSYWRGTVAQYLSQLDALAEEVRLLNPSLKTVLSSFTSGSMETVTDPTLVGTPKFEGDYALLTTLLADNASYDVVDLHFYGCPDDIAKKISWVKDHLPGDKLWISTENGGPNEGYCDYPVQGRYVNWSDSTELAAYEAAQANQVTSRLTVCGQNGGFVCLWFSLTDLPGVGDAFGHLGLAAAENPLRQKQSYTSFRTYTGQNTNQAPVINPISDKSVIVGTTLTFTISGSDPNDNPLTYAASNLPSGATFANQTFTWTPTTQQAGEYQNVGFSVSDGALTAREDMAISANLNQPPIFVGLKNQAGTEGKALVFSINATDPENNPLQYDATNLPNGAAFADQILTWTPGNQQAGTYQVRFTVSDGQFTTAQDVTLAIQDITPPALVSLSNQTVQAGSSLTFTVTATDQDQDSMTYSATKLPAGATLTNNQFSWQPTADQAGTYPGVQFRVTDGTFSSSVEITITVTPAVPAIPPESLPTQPPPSTPPSLQPITPPIANAGTAIVLPVQVSTTAPAAVTLKADHLPDGATFTDNGNGKGVLNWTPRSDQVGIHTVTFIISDGTNTASQDVVITVEAAGVGGAFQESKPFTALPATQRTGFSIAAGNVWDDARDEVLVGTGKGVSNRVRIFSNDGTLRSTLMPYPKTFKGGVRVAACDLDGTGKNEVITAPGPGYAPYIRFYNSSGHPVLQRQIWALNGKTKVGLHIACADLNNDGKAEIIAASENGSGQVTIHQASGRRLANFFPFGKSYKGGVTVAVNTSRAGTELLLGQETGNAWRRFTVKGKPIGPLLLPFGKAFAGGINLVAGDLTGNGTVSVVVGAGTGNGRVQIFSADGRTRQRNFTPYGTAFKGGVQVAVGDVDGDGAQDVITVPATSGAATVKFFDSQGHAL